METLRKKIKFEGKILAKSGLHIGGTNSAMAIGGPDSTVIRNPVDNKPYIPGSSLKGKMRSLIEITDGTIDFMQKKIPNGPSIDPESNSGILFGTARPDDRQRPSRLIVRDGELLSPPEKFSNTDLPYTESKTEIVLDRITAKTDLRQIERVPAGAEFKLDLVLNIFDGDNETELIETVLRGLKLVEDDYLGGSGSRGSGQVAFTLEKITERTVGYYKDEVAETDITAKYPFTKS